MQDFFFVLYQFPSELFCFCSLFTTKVRSGLGVHSFVKVEVDVLGSPSFTVFVVSVDVKQH